MKYQKALDILYNNIDGCNDCDNFGCWEKDPNGCDWYKKIKESKATLQELIDICSKPNSIKLKLDCIQDVIDCCYETDNDGKIIKSEFNNDVDLANEYLQDIKQAYSFRIEDARIINELQELLGNCCISYIPKRIKELLIIEKAFDISIKDSYRNGDYKEHYLNKAKEELESEQK